MRKSLGPRTFTSLETRKFIADAIRRRRQELDMTLEQLGAKVGLSDEQVRRIEKNETTTSIINLLRIARALHTGIATLIPSWLTEQDQIDELWAHYAVGKEFPGLDEASYETRKEMLVRMGLWVPPEDAALAHPFGKTGLVGDLPNKGALNRILAALPKNTRMVRILGISGVQSLESPSGARPSAALARLAESVAQERTEVEFLLLSPKSKYYQELRALEMGTIPSANNLSGPQIKQRIQESMAGIKSAAGDRVRCYEYDRWPLFRIVLIDRRAYVTFYPLAEGSQTPVLIFEADNEGRSFYWACHRVWFDYLQFPQAASPKEHGRAITAAALYKTVADDAAKIIKSKP